jgi:hypothetical protein
MDSAKLTDLDPKKTPDPVHPRRTTTGYAGSSPLVQFVAAQGRSGERGQHWQMPSRVVSGFVPGHSYRVVGGLAIMPHLRRVAACGSERLLKKEDGHHENVE